MKTTKVIRCASCKKRIRTHEPDLVLDDFVDGKRRYFHVGCGSAAYALCALEGPDVYRLTVRHVDASRN